MKKILSILLIMFAATINAQFTVDKFYEDLDSYLIKSEVIEVQGTKQELLTKVKNWASTAFNNSSKTLVSETNNQLVFNYISNDLNFKLFGVITDAPWYIRLVVQVKENKVRVLMYDDGNVRGQYVADRVNKIQNYFRKKKGTPIKVQEVGIINFKESCIDTIKRIEKSITQQLTEDSSW